MYHDGRRDRPLLLAESEASLATALELGPEGWKPYIEALDARPEPVLSPEEIAERERLLAKAREAAVMLKAKYGATRVVLFGSLAHQAWFHARSDVDLAVEGIAPEAFSLAWEEAQMLVGRSLDLVRVSAATPAVRRAIARHGRPL